LNEQRPQLEFSTLYAAHRPYVRRVLTRRGIPTADLDDLTQEVFVVVHRQLPSFEGRAKVETWLHAVAWRTAANYWRRRKADIRLSDEYEQDAELEQAPLVSAPGARLRALLNDIDEQQRDLLALHEIGGLSISELSNITGNARATIRQALERARAALGRQIRATFAGSDDDAWLSRFGPRFENEPLTLPLEQPIVFERNVFSCVGDTVIAVWRSHGSVASHEALFPLLFAMAEAHAPGFRYLNVIQPGAAPPTREGRDLIAWGLAKLGPALRAAAWVAESSLLVSVVAPFMNTAFFLAGSPVNARYFDELEPASRWLAEHGRPRDAIEIASHFERLRRWPSES
jgi:RNA polymerase sigma-70 factor (ECF subfamily)